MSATLQQIFTLNPITSNAATDLMYFVQSPYTPGTDAGMTFANFAAQFVLSTAIINPAQGGTGVNNGTNTITLGGNILTTGALTTTGAFGATFNFTATTNVTFPTSGTLATTSQILSSPLTTKGDIWVFSTVNTRLPVATGDGKILQVSSVAATGLAYSTPTYPSASGTARKVLISDGTNVIYSTETYAIPGTSGNVLTSDGTNWISAPPAVTTVLTTKGDILGFSTVDARIPVGSTNGQILQVNSANAVGVGYSTTTYPTTNAINTLLYASAANVMSALATANNGTLVTNATGVPSILAGPGTTGNFLQSNAAAAPSWSLSTITLGGNFTTSGAFTTTLTVTGATNVTLPTSGTLATTSQIPSLPVSLANGGTNASLTASNGGIFYSTGTAGAILAGTATANQILLSGASTTPAWSTATYPATTTINQILYSNSANVIAGISSVNSAVLSTNGSGVPSFSTILPSGIAATNMVLTTPNCGTPSAINLSNATALASVALPAGTLFNTQSTNTTTVSTTTSATMANISGVTVTITPTSSSNKILVRAVIQTSSTSTAAGYFQLARGGSAIGVGAAAGTRTTCGAASIGLSGTAAMQTLVMEFLDAPATTSATTYTAQFAADGSIGTVSVNASNTDTNTSAFPRTSSTITVYEVHA